MSGPGRPWGLLAGVFLALVAAGLFLPAYHQGALARILVLATFAGAYNIAFGQAGLLSLGHALFFAGGLYGAGLAGLWGGVPAVPAFLLGIAAGGLLAALVGLLALRTEGVAFMIVTLMVAQAGHLALLWTTPWTRGDEGFTIPAELRQAAGVALSGADVRFAAALLLWAGATALALALVRSPTGRALAGIRENAARAALLGYDTFRLRLLALAVSGAMAGAAGAAYGLLFGYVGATFASVQYSILPLLWVLLGGAGTLLGPLVGTILMFYLIDLLSGLTDAYMLVAGAALLLLTLFAPKGLMGEVRRRFAPWLP